jgi:hypothetical protein
MEFARHGDIGKNIRATHRILIVLYKRTALHNPLDGACNAAD